MSRRLSFLLSLVLVSALSLPARAGLDVRQQAASAGRPELLIAPRAGTSGTLVVRYNVGGFDDDQLYGLTRLTQRALIDGNSALGPEFIEELYAEHAELQVETSIRSCSFVLTAPRSSFSRLAMKLLKGLHQPKLTKGGLERARRLTFDDQQLNRGVDALIAMLGGEILLTEVSSGGGDYRNPPRGDRASVAELKLKAVENHAKRFFVPANATVAATGAVNSKLNKALNKLRGGSRQVIKLGDTSGLPRELERFAPSEMHLHAQILELKTAQDVAAARVLEALVWERMIWRLRRQGVTYTPFVWVVTYEWLDMLIIFVPVSSSRERGIRVEPLLREYLDQLIVDVPDEDFIKNRDYVLEQMKQIDGDPGLLAGELMRKNARIRWHHDEVHEAIQSLSKEAFLARARQWLGPERSANFLFGRSRAKYKRSR